MYKCEIKKQKRRKQPQRKLRNKLNLYNGKTIQKNIFELGSCLACENPADAAIIKRLPKETEEMELQIDSWDKQMPPLKNFILPGGSTAGSALHLSRTFVRQSERAYHRLGNEYKLKEISIYINRLSDFMFEMARFVNHSHKQVEQIWQQEKQL